jgi:hypothetical protein
MNSTRYVRTHFIHLQLDLINPILMSKRRSLEVISTQAFSQYSKFNKYKESGGSYSLWHTESVNTSTVLVYPFFQNG